MRLRPALAVLSATALLGLAACGGTADDGSATATATGSSGAQTSSPAGSSGSGDAEDVAFCAQGLDALDQFDAQLNAAGPDGLTTILPQVVATLDTLDPPAAFATDFQTLRDGYDQLAQAAAANDLTTAEGQAAFETVFTQVGTTAQSAEDAINAWTAANCGNEGASPTS